MKGKWKLSACLFVLEKKDIDIGIGITHVCCFQWLTSPESFQKEQRSCLFLHSAVASTASTVAADGKHDPSSPTMHSSWTLWPVTENDRKRNAKKSRKTAVTTVMIPSPVGWMLFERTFKTVVSFSWGCPVTNTG